MSWLSSIGIDLCRPSSGGGGTPTPTPTPSVPSDPVLSNLSTGWTTGQNPPAWQSTYAGVQGYAPLSGAGDQVQARWQLGASGWTLTAWEGLDDELATGDGVAWTFLTDGSLNAGGAFAVQERLVRDKSLATEQFSNWSASWTDTLSNVAESASSWATSNGASKSQYVTVNGTGNLVAAGQGGFSNAPISTRATNSRLGKRQFQTTVSAPGGNAIWLGVDDGTTNFNSGFVRPGRDNSLGVSFKATAFQWDIYVGGVNVQTASATAKQNGDEFFCEFNTTTGDVSFYRLRSGSTVQMGTTVNLSLSAWYANVGFEDADTQTAKFGSGQDRALSSGYVPYDN